MKSALRLAVLSSLLLLVPGASRGAELQIEEPPQYGVYYQGYTPAFYTGFAPRVDDPARIHLHVGRGNQVRITAVLSDDGIRRYARDLLARKQTVDALVAEGRMTLVQNSGFEQYEKTLKEKGVARLVERDLKASPEKVWERNLKLLEKLNPGRVFRIRMPVDELFRRWVARLRPEDQKKLGRDRRLELINAMLPTRLWVTETDRATRAELQALVRAEPPTQAAFLALLGRVSGGRYPQRGDALEFVEFTAVHPIGTFNDYVEHHGRKIPLYPTPGRRAFTTHQRTKTVDHIPTVAAYSYFPWLPYMHVGTKLHNSFHTLWWAMDTSKTSFLPEEWDAGSREARNGKPYKYLWLLSRGPMSSGCTHLNAGHISELRQVMPSDTARMYDVDVFLNRSYDYDVFDIDGDFEPEVMGVEYFIAYSLRNKKPNRLRVRNERHAYYEWLYAGEITYDDDDQVWFPTVQDGRYVERTAKRGRTYENLRLREVPYEPERVQFFSGAGIDFARELRKVSADHGFGSSKTPQ